MANRLSRRTGVYVLTAAAVVSGAAMWLGSDDPEKSKLGQTFNQIYESGKWDKGAEGRGTSGPGSTLEATAEYRAFLADFIKTRHVHSVVDAGCGDWTFSSAIDWNQARYLGIDVSTEVIAFVKKRYTSKNVTFEVGDVTRQLPSADLLLCKDVLQHLPNQLVADFIKNNLVKGKYKWAIITNDRGPNSGDIAAGEHRPLDLSAPPFNVKGLVDLPVKAGGGFNKVVQILDLS